MTYEDIYSKFLSKITDRKLLGMEQEDAYLEMKEYLQTAMSQVYFQKMFKELNVDEDFEEITYKMEISVERYNESFIIDVLSEGMVIAWMRSKLDTDVSLALGWGGKEEKVLKNSYKENLEHVEALEKRLKKKIRDYGYSFGSYGD